jgi:hypothetical protein
MYLSMPFEGYLLSEVILAMGRSFKTKKKFFWGYILAGGENVGRSIFL